MVPDVAREAEVMREARRAADRMVTLLAARAESRPETAVLAELAGREMESYAKLLLGLLMSAAEGAHERDSAAWVQRLYHECVAEVGAALRDAIRISGARHAVAQTLQAKIFEAENELRAALGAERAS